ncbi:MAG: hypothetical protein OEN23_05945 [Paracoccaceae bacterium]|nr:hypothetical protein [Paracoccaceae bacterium]
MTFTFARTHREDFRAFDLIRADQLPEIIVGALATARSLEPSAAASTIHSVINLFGLAQELFNEHTDLPDHAQGAIGDAATAAKIVDEQRRTGIYSKLNSLIQADVDLIENGFSASELAERPLWEGAVPESINRLWLSLCAMLNSRDEGWEVWIDWYNDRVIGRPFKTGVEENWANLDPDLWDQGAKAVNVAIAEVIRDRRAWEAGTSSLVEPPPGAVQSGGEPSIESEEQFRVKLRAVLSSVELRAALTDFRYDPSTNQIELVPFESDFHAIPEGRLGADYADKLAALAESCSNLAEDLDEDAPNVPRALSRDLQRYARQASGGPNRANPRLLKIYSAALVRAHQDSETLQGLGPYLGGKLGDIVRADRGLWADFPEAFGDLVEAAAEIDLPPAATTVEVVQTLDIVATEIDAVDWGDLPVPSRDLPELLHDQAERLREIDAQIDRAGEAADREKLHRMRRQMEVSGLATLARFSVVLGLATAVTLAPAAASATTAIGTAIYGFVEHLYPETLRPHIKRAIDWVFIRQQSANLED